MKNTNITLFSARAVGFSGGVTRAVKRVNCYHAMQNRYKIPPITGGHYTPWDMCLATDVHRRPPSGTELELLDRGVNFFILALESMGAQTHHSCEGHPRGFYIVFSATESLAREIEAAGYFSIQICRANGTLCDGWRMALNEAGAEFHSGEPWSASFKANTLRHASEAWVKNLAMPYFWGGFAE